MWNNAQEDDKKSQQNKLSNKQRIYMWGMKCILLVFCVPLKVIASIMGTLLRLLSLLYNNYIERRPCFGFMDRKKFCVHTIWITLLK